MRAHGTIQKEASVIPLKNEITARNPRSFTNGYKGTVTELSSIPMPSDSLLPTRSDALPHRGDARICAIAWAEMIKPTAKLSAPRP